VGKFPTSSSRGTEAFCEKMRFVPRRYDYRSPHTTPHVVTPTAEHESMFVLFITFVRTVFNARAH
jgi:hypothetical protein